MNYMLLIYTDEAMPGMDAAKAEKCGGLAERVHARGQWISGGILQPTATAKSVRMREGRRLLTDGPFAETREQLAGYMLIQAKDEEEALAIAAEHPASEYGTVEVRPVLEIPFFQSTSVTA